MVLKLKAGFTPTGLDAQEELAASGREFVQLVDQTQVAGPSRLINIGCFVTVALLAPAAH